VNFLNGDKPNWWAECLGQWNKEKEHYKSDFNHWYSIKWKNFKSYCLSDFLLFSDSSWLCLEQRQGEDVVVGMDE